MYTYRQFYTLKQDPMSLCKSPCLRAHHAACCSSSIYIHMYTCPRYIYIYTYKQIYTHQQDVISLCTSPCLCARHAVRSSSSIHVDTYTYIYI